MYYDLRFPYRLEKGCKIGTQEDGTLEEVYLEFTVNRAKKPITPEKYEEMHEKHRQDFANMLGEDVSLVTPITGEEYEANADLEE